VTLRTAALALILLTLASAGASPARARLVEKIAAVVGENIILASEVEEKAAPLLAEANRIPDPTKRA